MWIKTHRCLVHMKDPLLIHESSPSTSVHTTEYGSKGNQTVKPRWAQQQTLILHTRVVPVNRGLYKYIKNLMSQNNKTFYIYQILYYTHNK